MRSFTQVVVGFDGHGTVGRFAEVPRHCPVCGHHTDPWRLAARAVDPEAHMVDFVFQCTRDNCRRVFIATYVPGLDGEMDLLQPHALAFGGTRPELFTTISPRAF
jgi:hypothetical protein